MRPLTAPLITTRDSRLLSTMHETMPPPSATREAAGFGQGVGASGRGCLRTRPRPPNGAVPVESETACAKVRTWKVEML